jgi:hypothetical protein
MTCTGEPKLVYNRVGERSRSIMTRIGLPAAILGLLAASAALAEPSVPPPEHVIVTATKLQDQIHSFVRSYAAPSPAIGKLARWRDPICPVAAGMSDALAATVVKRVREIAAMVGAPVGSSSCHGNIDIVFTYSPQILLNDVRAHHPVLLGYHDVAQETDLATVRHTVQSWYATQTADVGGSREVDDKQTHAYTQMSIYVPNGYQRGSLQTSVPVEFDVPAQTKLVTGNHMSDGLSSELFHVIVTVNAGKIGDGQIAGITDYVAMLALAQTTAFETCQGMSSVTGIVTDNCPTTSQSITITDLAYLRALYKTDPARNLAQRRDDVADEMDKALSPH